MVTIIPHQPELAASPIADVHRHLELLRDTGAWRRGLPALRAHGVTVRELQLTDAAALLDVLSTDDVSRFISTPPNDVPGLKRFIAWSIAERMAGQSVVFGIVPGGCATAVGLIQLRALEPGFATAEWGFAIGSAFWGTGLFEASARRVVDFAIEQVGIHRLEARAAVGNARGNGVLRKLGAVHEGILRKSFHSHGTMCDQALWSIVDDEWRQKAERLAIPIIRLH
ncbi:MAG: GNAT family N-acetyltransferase [Vicinamibacterales bacterium]